MPTQTADSAVLGYSLADFQFLSVIGCCVYQNEINYAVPKYVREWWEYFVAFSENQNHKGFYLIIISVCYYGTRQPTTWNIFVLFKILTTPKLETW